MINETCTGAYLGCFRLTDSQGLSEVRVHSIVSLPLPLGWLDPVPHSFVFVPVILSLKLIHAAPLPTRVHGEGPEGTLTQIVVLGFYLFCLGTIKLLLIMVSPTTGICIGIKPRKTSHESEAK